jgi:hypothetical protein
MVKRLNLLLVVNRLGTSATRRPVEKLGAVAALVRRLRRFGRSRIRATKLTDGDTPPELKFPRRIEVLNMVALLALVLILAIFGGLGFAAHVLWYVLIFAVLLWLIGFFIGGVEGGGRRRWYGRW